MFIMSREVKGLLFGHVDLIERMNEKVIENRRFKIYNLSPYFPGVSRVTSLRIAIETLSY